MASFTPSILKGSLSICQRSFAFTATNRLIGLTGSKSQEEEQEDREPVWKATWVTVQTSLCEAEVEEGISVSLFSKEVRTWRNIIRRWPKAYQESSASAREREKILLFLEEVEEFCENLFHPGFSQRSSNFEKVYLNCHQLSSAGKSLHPRNAWLHLVQVLLLLTARRMSRSMSF
jgi:hypothetical protein